MARLADWQRRKILYERYKEGKLTLGQLVEGFRRINEVSNNK